MKERIAFVSLFALSIPLLASAQDSSGTSRNVTSVPGAFLRMHPSRGLNDILSLWPDLVPVNGDLHVRGSRSRSTGFSLNGLPATDIYSGDRLIPFIPEALEQLSVQTGPSTRFSGGSIDMKLREGGETLLFDAKFLTDDVVAPGKQFLQTSSFGSSALIATASGPLPFKSTFFIAAEHRRRRDRDPRFVEPVDFPLVVDDNAWYFPAGTPLPAPFVLTRNHVPSNGDKRTSSQWNVYVRPIGLSLTGSHSFSDQPYLDFDEIVSGFYRQRRHPLWKEAHHMLGARVESKIRPDVSLILIGTMTSNTAGLWDPDFGGDWRSYVDSAANATIGYSGFSGRYFGPGGYTVHGGFGFDHEHRPTMNFEKERSTSYHARARVNWNVSSGTQLGFEFGWTSWNLRWFSVPSISNYRRIYDTDADGIDDRQWSPSEGPSAERIYVRQQSGIQGFGYDHRGMEVEHGPDAPRRPSTHEVHFNGSHRSDNLFYDAQLSFSRVSLDIPEIVYSPSPLGPPYREISFDYDRNMVDEDQMKTSDPVWYVLPNASFAYLGDAWTVRISLSSMAQPPPMKDVYIDNFRLSALVNPLRSVPYNLGGPVSPMGVRAERTRHVEIRSDIALADDMRLDIAIYYKSLTDQLELGRETYGPNSSGNTFVRFQNSGEGTIHGATLTFVYTPTNATHLRLSYGLVNTSGSSSHPRSNQKYLTDEYSYFADVPPGIAYPFDYEVPHRLIFTGKFDGAPESRWSGFRAYTECLISSGHRYTRSTPIRNLGASTAYTIGVRNLIDTRSFVPLEPANASLSPMTFDVNLSLSYRFDLAPFFPELFIHVMNVLDRRNVTNVYPATGHPNDDGWMASPFAQSWKDVPGYEAFYRALNLENRWAYSAATGNDVYGRPRQMRFGIRAGI